MLGTSHVDGAADHDVIRVGVRDGRFRSIQLRVKRAPIEFFRVIVRYADGEPEEIPVRENIRAGGKTREIDLRGRERFIRDVEVWYGKGSWRIRRPELELWGIR